MTHETTRVPQAIELENIEQAMVELIVSDRVKLWAYPNVAVRLGEVLRRENVSLVEVSRIVSADPVLASAVMRLANSATYRRSGAELLQISDAVGRIGLQAVHHVAVAAGIGKEVCRPGPLQVLRFRAWRWSVSSALLCQELAPRRLVEPGVAFLGGLLHAFGRAVALSALEQVLGARSGSIVLPAHQWHSIVEARHRDFGSLVARKWSLPPLVTAVLVDDSPGLDESARSRLVELCMLADRVVTTVELGPGVTPDELRSLPGFVNEDELRYVTSIVERLPWAIEALLGVAQPPSPPARALPCAVALPASSLRGAQRPVDFPVVDVKANGQTEFRATHVAHDGLVIVGAAAMQVNSIVRLELRRGGSPLLAWVRVAQCESTDRGYRIEVQPYALGREDRVRWSDSVETEKSRC